MSRLPIFLSCLLALASTPGLAAETGTPPASMSELAITSHGARLNGFIYRAAGAGAHPTVLFLHGYPGNERNLDLAQVVRRAGYNALYIDYRGSWGSGGTFAPSSALEDVEAVLAWARDPGNASRYGIDPGQLSLVGHSFGGWLALMTASRDRSLRCVSAMAAWNLGWVGGRLQSHPDEAKELRTYIDWTTEPGGPMRLDTDGVIQEFSAHADDWNYLSLAPALKDRPLLLVAATRDSPDVGVELHQQLEKGIRAKGGSRVDTLVYEDDHSFSSHRIELGEALLSWLQGNCPGGRAGSDSAPAPSQAKSEDVAAIELVVESFRTSLINKDKATYMSLFFSDKPEDIGWQFVSEDTRLVHIRKTKPDAIKARQIAGNNFISLIDGAVAAKEPREETFSNVSVDTDGEVASVSFDYSFLANGKKTNWGKELWQLVRTEKGWKIFSVVYTIRDQWSVAEG